MESGIRNLESRTLLDYLTWGEITDNFLNCPAKCEDISPLRLRILLDTFKTTQDNNLHVNETAKNVRWSTIIGDIVH